MDFASSQDCHVSSLLGREVLPNARALLQGTHTAVGPDIVCLSTFALFEQSASHL